MGLLDQRPKLLGIFKDSAVASEDHNVVTVNSKWVDLVSRTERHTYFCVHKMFTPFQDAQFVKENIL